MKILFWSLTWFLSMALPGNGQHFSAINYNIEHGLPQTQVTSITQDDYGYLWIGTAAGGLSRFDGKLFENYTTGHGLLSPSIQSLAWTPDTLWIGTNQGLNMLTNGKISENTNLSGQEIKKILPQDYRVWVATTKGGIYQITGDTTIHYSAANGFTDHPVLDMELDPEGHVWVLTTGATVYHFADRKFVPHIQLPNSTTQSILPVSKNQLLAGTPNGLLTYQIKDGKVTLTGTDIPRANVREISLFDNELWLVVQNGLMWKKAGSFLWLSAQNGFSNAPVFQIFHDREGIIWAGTYANGLFKFLRGPFQKLTFPPHTFADFITDIKQYDPQRIVVTTLGKGAFEVTRDHTINPLKLPPRSRNISNSAYLNGYHFLASFEEGILIKSGNSFRPLPEQPAYTTPPFFVGYSDDRLFVSDRHALYSLQGTELKKVRDSINVFLVYQTISGILLGTDNGLMRMDEGQVTKIETGQPLDHELITCVQGDVSGNLLVGTLGYGLWIFPGGQLENTKPLHLLPVDHITFIFAEGNRIYCGTQRGVSMFELSSKMKITSQRWLNRDNGLYANETVNETVLKSSFGEQLWFGTVDGLFIYDPQEQYTIQERPILSITNVGVSGQSDSLLRQSWFKKFPPTLPANASTLSFEFKAVSLLMPEYKIYQYRLKGLSDRWSPPSAQNNIRFTNLSSGHYDFEVRAVNNHGHELARQTMAFQILTPFWQSWWFLTVFGVMIVVIIWLLIRIRILKVIKIQEQTEQHNRQMRRELAKDFHDELGNHLASIISLLQVLKMKAPTFPENVNKQFALLNRHANDLFFGTKDFIASIDPQHETLGWIMLYLQDFGEQIFSNADITFECTQTENWQNNLRVRARYSRHLILIFKEAMTNTLKHAAASEVNLTVSRGGADLVFTLSDNGRGFDFTTTQATSIGVKSMEERARKINATLVILSSSKGTTITLRKENYAHWTD